MVDTTLTSYHKELIQQLDDFAYSAKAVCLLKGPAFIGIIFTRAHALPRAHIRVHTRTRTAHVPMLTAWLTKTEQGAAAAALPPIIPLWIPLKQYQHVSSGEILEAYVKQQTGWDAAVICALKAEHVVFILDGYGEWGHWQNLARTNQLYLEWPNAKLLVTCSHSYLAKEPYYASYFMPVKGGRWQTESFQEITVPYVGAAPFSHGRQSALEETGAHEQSLPEVLIGQEILEEALAQQTLAPEVAAKGVTIYKLNDYMIQFSADRIRCGDVDSAHHKQILLTLVEHSKTRQSYAVMSAAKAITVLNASGMVFSGTDFTGVRIAGADLSGALMHYTILSKADLRGVNFTRAYLDSANLSESDLTDIQLGEWPDLQHEGFIMSIAFSADGQWQAVASGTDIHIWSAVSGERVKALQGHTDDVECVAFSIIDGRLASGGRDNTIRIWDVGSGQEIQVLQGHESVISSVAFSVGGYLASGSWDGTVRVWDLGSGQAKVLQGHTKWVLCVAFAPNGCLASGSRDCTVRLWDINSGQETQVLRGHTGHVTSMAFSPHNRLATGSADKTIRIWEICSGHEVQVLQGHSIDVTGLAFATEGHLASCSTDLTVRVWDIDRGGQTHLFAGHTKQVVSVAFSPDGRLASGGGDRVVRMWSIGSEHNQLSQVHTSRIQNLATTASGLLAAASIDDTVRLWDIDGRLIRIFRGNCVAFSPNELLLAIGGLDGSVHVWDLKSGQVQTLQEGKHTTMEKSVGCVAFSANSHLLAAGNDDRSVRVWDLDSGQMQVLSGHTEPVRRVAFLPNSHRLVSGAGDVRIWDLDSGKAHLLQVLQREYGDHVISLVFAPNGHMAFGASLGGIWIWDLDNIDKGCMEFKSSTLKGGLNSIAFSPDGACIAIGWRHRIVEVVGVKTKLSEYYALHRSAVACVVFTADGNLAVGFDQGTVAVWQPTVFRDQEIKWLMVFSTTRYGDFLYIINIIIIFLF